MAVTRSVLNSIRSRSTETTDYPVTEDWDGNILRMETSKKITYYYSPDAIPAGRLEVLLRLMTIPREWNQSLTLLHQHTQCKWDYLYSFN